MYVSMYTMLILFLLLYIDKFVPAGWFGQCFYFVRYTALLHTYNALN